MPQSITYIRIFALIIGSLLIGRIGLMAQAVEPPQSETSYFQYLPVVPASNYPKETPESTLPPLQPPLPVPEIYGGNIPINFTVARHSLEARGKLLATNKVGFHVGIGGDLRGLDTWMESLDAAGVPIFLKSADNAAPLYQAQELMRKSGVQHTLIYRRTGVEYDIPNYDLPAAEAARVHWERHIAAFPPELDKNLVWLETVNEVDKGRNEWLVEFAYETAQLALRDGYKWAAFGWSSGEPEPYHWENPKMINFLRFVSQHPNQLAIALHEYSYTRDNIGNIYPYLIGRFQHMFEICDAHNIARPTTFITEWGWEYQNIPSPEEAIADIAWASWLYAAYPEVKGAAIWYLGGYFGTIDQQTQRLIAPVTDYSLTHYFGVTPGRGQIDTARFTPNTDPRSIPNATLQTQLSPIHKDDPRSFVNQN